MVQNDTKYFLLKKLSVLLHLISKRNSLFLCEKCSALLPYLIRFFKTLAIISVIVFRVKGIAFLQSVALALSINEFRMTFFAP
jgi:hypothetical protein